VIEDHHLGSTRGLTHQSLNFLIVVLLNVRVVVQVVNNGWSPVQLYAMAVERQLLA
jgi:hypothetical protein